MGQNRRSKAIVIAIITLLAEGSCFVTLAKPQSSVGKEVGLWHMDEVIPAEYRSLTPDATGANPGTLIHAPADPVLVGGKFGKALSFDGQNGVYVPIRF